VNYYHTGYKLFVALFSGDQIQMLKKAFLFYYDGFRSMVVGRTLWKLIFIKLVIMFAILKAFFFPDFLATNFTTDAERADHVLTNLTQVATGEDAKKP
jgi:Domain of unknown function (DUF4492)